MRLIGLKLLTLLYLGVGGTLGEFFHGTFLGRLPVWLSDRRGFLIAAGVSNMIALWCLARLWRQCAVTPTLHSMGKPLELLTFNFRSNARVAFLLFSIAWVIGVILGLVLSF